MISVLCILSLTIHYVTPCVVLETFCTREIFMFNQRLRSRTFFHYGELHKALLSMFFTLLVRLTGYVKTPMNNHNWWWRGSWRHLLKPRSYCAYLEIPITTISKIVENGMVDRLMKSWQHRTNICEVHVTRSGRIGNDREASTTVLNCKTLSYWPWLQPQLIWHLIESSVKRSCVWSETSWTCRTQRVGSRGQRVGSRENPIIITMVTCLIHLKFTKRSSNLQSTSRYICVYMFIL